VEGYAAWQLPNEDIPADPVDDPFADPFADPLA
jgi:hypothetical protein